MQNSATSGDIWPGHTMNWNVNNLKAKYGEQTDWLYSDKSAFNAYLVCGNKNWYEGEGGWTYDSLMIDECDDAGVTVSLSDPTLDEKDIQSEWTATVRLDKDYAICDTCTITMKWNSIFKPSSMRLETGTG